MATKNNKSKNSTKKEVETNKKTGAKYQTNTKGVEINAQNEADAEEVPGFREDVNQLIVLLLNQNLFRQTKL